MSAHVGLVGCGRWGKLILRDLLELGCSVTVAAPGAETRQAAVAGGAAGAVETVAGLAGVDGIVVAVPTPAHAAVIHEALDLDVPVFTEKPMTDDAAAARELATRAPDSLFVMDKWRYHPGVIRLAELAQTGSLGRVLGVSTRRWQWGDSHPESDPVWTLLPHDLSIALHILGSLPEPVTATAVEGPVPDTSGRVDAFRPGLAGLLGVLGTDPWVVADVSGRAPYVSRECIVHGDEGVARLSSDDYTTVVIRRADEPEPIVETVAATMPLLAELEAFVAHLTGDGPPPRSSAADGAAIVAAIETLRTLARAPR